MNSGPTGSSAINLLSLQHKRANRQYVAIRDSELWRFIDSRDKLYVAFPMKSGYPHVSPIWFCVLDKKLYLRTQDYKVKTKLARAGKACCTLEEGHRYRKLRGVIIWGPCRVLTEQPLIDSIEKIMRMKYRDQQWKSSEMPRWWVDERKAERRAYIEIIPQKISSWDNSRIN